MRPVPTRSTVAVDFSRLADYPLSHDRIGLFNSGLVTIDRYERDRGSYSRVRPEHLRIDLGWGAEWMPWTREVVTVGADGTDRYDFAETDAIATFLRSEGVRPYWAYCYVPVAARPDGGDWRTMGSNDSRWVDTVRAYVAGSRDRGVDIGYHEVYNEPDLRDERTGEAVFYAGTLDDYLDLYRSTARAIREADPTARVGGPALASVNANAHWLRAFLDVVTAEQLPLDFLSFHHYGSFGLRPVLATVLGILSDYPQLAEVELHLNEYNSFTIDYPRGGLQDSHLLASAFAADLETLLGTPSLTRVSWAQFQDSGNDNYSGMVDIDGRAKPLYLAYEFYQRMPVTRVVAEVDGAEGVGALASSEGRYAAVLLWNRSIADQEIRLTAEAAPGEPSAVILDDRGDHERRRLELRNGAVSLRLQRGAVALVQFGEPPAAPEVERVVHRSRLRNPDRFSTAWADVDEQTATIRLGTAREADAVVSAGVELSAGRAPSADTEIRFADGTPAPGRVDVETTRDGERHTVWATLSGAPAGVFATVTVRA